MSTAPDLPEPPYQDLDPMLTRKFGKEIANYFAGSPLNRVSFLRSDHIFLSSALHHPTASFLLFNDLKPLVKDPTKLAFAKFQDVKPLVGGNPFAKPEEQIIEDYNSSTTIPQMVFLGLDERIKDGLVHKDVYTGGPMWALDVTPKGSIKAEAQNLVETLESSGLNFQEGRMILSLPAHEAAIYAQARSMLDWNARNPFCAGCGQPTLSINAGGKRACPPKDFAQVQGVVGSTTAATPTQSADRKPCATRGRVSNLSFPRTDPTVIMAVISSDGDRLLLGRQKTWPPYWYSTLAGFCEPAESLEEAVRREVWEEAGVRLSRVVIHSSQPWPYPANLMIGAIGQAVPGSEIDLGNDPELEDARWWTFEDLREALRVGTSGLGEPAGPEYKEGNLRLPPPTAFVEFCALLNRIGANVH
ncbi:MAG: NADH pyrophosphatase [Alyxoria varia]|nr:MAG: NADH pyrophosphatase [Alyxoria varia]